MAEEALDRTQCKPGFGSGYGPLVRQTAQWIHKIASLSAVKN